jgi:hypothetical protein
VIEETDHLDHLDIRLGGRTISESEVFCTDPRLPKFEVNFAVPANVADGTQRLDLRLGRKAFPPIYIEVSRN